jgi:hypothetical protein
VRKRKRGRESKKEKARERKQGRESEEEKARKRKWGRESKGEKARERKRKCMEMIGWKWEEKGILGWNWWDWAGKRVFLSFSIKKD